MDEQLAKKWTFRVQQANNLTQHICDQLLIPEEYKKFVFQALLNKLFD